MSGGYVMPLGGGAPSGGSGVVQWRDLDPALAPGDTLVFCPFSGDIDDHSGNGLDLSPAVPFDLLFVDIDGKTCLRMDGISNMLQRPGNDPSLQILGALSIFALCSIVDVSATMGASIVGFGTDEFHADTEPNNNLWGLGFLPASAQLVYAHEHGAGVNDNYEFSTAAKAALGLSLISVSRSAAGDVSMFVDGVSYGTIAGVPPSGGTSSIVRLRVGGDAAGGDLGQRSINGFHGGFFVKDAPHDLAIHTAQYEHVRFTTS